MLCYWQSLTNEQAAAQLGCPVGTVYSRLRRARKLLHRRLTGRGLAPLAGVVVTELAGSSASASPLAAVPEALVQDTVRAAAAAASGQTLLYVVSGSTAALVQRVLWSMAMIKIKTAVVGLTLVGFVGLGVAAVTVKGQPGKIKRQLGADAAAVASAPRSGPLKDPEGTALVHVLAREPVTLISLVRGGTTVKKGDVVCELDSAGLKDALAEQSTLVAVAEMTYRNRVKASEIAVLSLKEYAESLFRTELAEAQAGIHRAEGELALALDASESDKKNTPRSLKLRAARYALEAAQARKAGLLDYSRPKRVKELELALAEARMEETASKARWELEINKEKRLNRQIESCVIRAPRDGQLIHWGSLEEGALVQPHQLLFKIVP